MELKEAIEILEGLIEPQSTLLGSFDKEAVKTVLAELDRLNLENRKLKSTIEDITGIENADEEVWDE